jgi:hypothetical protein
MADSPRLAPDALASAEQVSVAQTVPLAVELSPRVTGSALSAAAFGLSALQPETYNGEIVIDIIDASPLDMRDKDRLTAKLLAAEAGHAKLPDVLEDIRLALAVE